ncbi:MAG TPA: LemA family protein, partial [Candidatus Binatus sp.]|nr:LemA family protein [Candidatus Binatus sp.]
MNPGLAAALLFALLLLVAVVVFLGVVTFNALVAMRQQVDKAWANIDVALRQRHDELPNLVDAVRGQLGFEQATLQRVTAARAAWAPEAPVPSQARVSEETSRAVRRLFGVVERYPQLHSDANVMALQAEIERLETVIADRRELYNDSVNRFNTRIAQLPGIVVASALGWDRRPFFTADPGDATRPST